jgi:hypothetical protein
MTNPISVRDVFQNHPFLMLPPDVLIVITSLLPSRFDIASGREIANFGRVCVLANDVANDPSFHRVLKEAEIAFRIFRMLKVENIIH